MSTIDAVWHVLNFIAPMFVIGTLMTVSAKVIWRRSLRSTSYLRLASFASAGAVVGYGVALAWLGRDGTIAAYAVMVITAALAVGWVLMRSTPG
jgi:hypothetical protein